MGGGSHWHLVGRAGDGNRALPAESHSDHLPVVLTSHAVHTDKVRDDSKQFRVTGPCLPLNCIRFTYVPKALWKNGSIFL